MTRLGHAIATADTVTAGLLGLHERQAVEDGQLTAWITRVGVPYHAPKGVTLFGQGASCQQVFYLEEGWVTLLRTEGTGIDMIVAVCRPGAILSAGAAFSQTVHPTTAITRTPARLRTVPVAALERAVHEDARIGRELLATLARETVTQIARCGALGCLGARARFERLLCELASASTPPVRLPLRPSELAGVLGIDISHARRLVRKLRDEGVIDTSLGWIIVRDVKRLRQ
jgi:CRP-like cAMP-binding protein